MFCSSKFHSNLLECNDSYSNERKGLHCLICLNTITNEIGQIDYIKLIACNERQPYT
jgi:hypothetical protein